jgi:5S rRNA maturation endonuclease (ribonuclease M5)
MDSELERFKLEISLADYAQACYGFELLKKDSGAHSKALKGPDGSKIIVARGQDGHDIYFNVHDERDNGSIIDFLQRRKHLNLGQVRRELRPWLPGAVRPAPQKPARAPDRPIPAPRAQLDVVKKWLNMPPYEGDYLPGRGIDPGIIRAFDIRQDERGNMCAAHRDANGICGWEIKNQGFTGFSAGGRRGLSFARLDHAKIERVVICESIIDAMSYAQLNHVHGDVYISMGGALSAHQKDLLMRFFSTTPGIQAVVLATDSDEAGERMASEIAQIAEQHGIPAERDAPPTGKDWNDECQQRQRGHDYGMAM